MNTLPRIVTAFIAAALLNIAGCGGGGGGGGSVTPPPITPPPTGGITRTGVAVGPITGFGSVIVNGVTYDTPSSTTFTKDGQSATQDDFSVGQVVLVKGSIDDDGTNATADTVEFNDVVEGPVASHNTTTGEFVVLGQTVRITPTTSFDDTPVCPADLTQAVAVEVSGLVDANGVVDATRIDCRDATWDGVMEVNGIVSGHNGGAMTFMINGLEIDYSSAASVDNFPTAGVINDGDPVEAKGTVFDSNTNTLDATRVEFKGNRFANDDGDHAEIEGFITRFGSATDFDVSGLPVTTTDSTTFEGGAAADLDINLKVEAEGEFNASGVLVATKVDIKSATAIRVTGALDSVSGNTVTILGITVNTDPLKTRFEDKRSEARIDPLRVGDLNSTDYVEIRGQEMPVGQITAMLLERDDADPRTELRGFVELGGKNDPNLTVLGVTINTDGVEVYRDSRGAADVGMTRAEFWAAVQEGSLVDARGTESGDTTLAATELELQMDQN